MTITDLSFFKAESNFHNVNHRCSRTVAVAAAGRRAATAGRACIVRLRVSAMPPCGLRISLGTDGFQFRCLHPTAVAKGAAAADAGQRLVGAAAPPIPLPPLPPPSDPTVTTPTRPPSRDTEVWRSQAYRLSGEEMLQRQSDTVAAVLNQLIGGQRKVYGKLMRDAAQVFALLDTDGSGRLDYGEFGHALRRMGLGLSPAQVAQLIQVGSAGRPATATRHSVCVPSHLHSTPSLLCTGTGPSCSLTGPVGAGAPPR